MGKKSNELNAQSVEVIQRMGGLAWRNNSGTIRTGKYFVHLAPKGSADVLGLLRGIFLSIETKVEDKPSADQLQWMQSVIDSGGRAIIVHDISEVIELCQSISIGG